MKIKATEQPEEHKWYLQICKVKTVCVFYSKYKPG